MMKSARRKNRVIEEEGRRPSRSLRADIVVPAAIALATFLVFSGTLRNGFLNWDDDLNFLNNPYYRGLGWAQLRWMLAAPHWGHYIPLTWLTLGLDFALWGMHPFGYHLSNLLLHCANAAVFYFVSRRLLALAIPASPSSSPGWLELAAGSSALFFALHPLRVEAVAWVTARRDVLFGFFYLLTVLFYLKASADQTQRPRWLRMSVVCFGLSLLSKISGLTLPLALLVLDIYPLGRLPGDPKRWLSKATRQVWLEKIPFILMMLSAGLMGMSAMGRSGAMLTMTKFSVTERLTQACFGLAFYVWKTFVPLRLSPLYSLFTLPNDRIDPWAAPFLISSMFVILTTAGALAMRRRWPAGLAVWVCYVATVLPVLGLAQSGQQIAADRYMYAPSLGLAVLVAGSSARLWRDSGRRALSNAAMIIAVLLAALSLLTWRYVKVWHDSESLWRRALDMDPAIASAHNNLGAALFGQGKLDEAIEHFDRALQLRPHYPSAHNNLGFALAGQGRLDEAVRHYRQALLINPQFAQARRNLEVVLQRSGPGTHDLRR